MQTKYVKVQHRPGASKESCVGGLGMVRFQHAAMPVAAFLRRFMAWSSGVDEEGSLRRGMREEGESSS